jgi:hypothetical protein
MTGAALLDAGGLRKHPIKGGPVSQHSHEARMLVLSKSSPIAHLLLLRPAAQAPATEERGSCRQDAEKHQNF